ncbi:MAG: outer membrane protein assembly factor BamB family protein, partial [Planctomycetota bacterium]
RFILSRTMLFVDVESGKYLRPWGLKNGCGYGSVLPANGLIYTFPHQCRCYPMLRGVVAMGDTVPPVKNGANGRLRRGPAFGFKGGAQPGESDWATYRGDSRRSAAAKDTVPAEAGLLWTSALGRSAPALWRLEWDRRGGGEISAPTAGGGRVFVARSQAHEVVALDAGGGKPVWRFSAGARVDVPPTVHRGLCLFGSADGWVYCLRADDGKEVWRFRAAPAARSVVAFGQLESAWPVRGGVLVSEGVAYAAAGRHSQIDGGAFVHALDPASGKVLWSKNPADYHGLVDVMVAGGKSVCFASHHYDRITRAGTNQFDPRTGATRPRGEKANDFLWSNTGLLSEMWTGEVYSGSRLSVWTRGKTTAQKMVFSNGRTYGFRAAPRKGQASLFSADAAGKGTWKTELPKKDRKLPVRCATAMALTGNVLWVAGRLAADSNREVLRAYSAADGKQLREISLDAPVVYDGIAAAGNRLYVSCQDGKLYCYGTK